MHLRPGTTSDLTRLAGGVITGGHDVEPVLYRAAEEVRGRYDPERDAFESSVIQALLSSRKPILAICRGAQLLNVLLGGNLVQDLRKRRKQTSNRRTLLPIKAIHVEQGTRLRDCLGPGRIKVNSLHRQGIDDLGVGLRVSARDLDGIVQAVEHFEHDFVVGVQWHPEFLVYSARQRELFGELKRSATQVDAGLREES